MPDNIIFHIDVNSAFLSWSAVKMLEEGSDIDIRNIDAIVGGDSRHGIVLAKSMSAKAKGISTAMPVAKAMGLCPDLYIVSPDHSYYKMMSDKFIDLMRDITEDIEQVSIDECYMNYTGISDMYESPVEAANIIKDRIKRELGFTVNIGISDVKVLAKMASDFKKPDRVHTLYKCEIEEKMWPLDIRDLYMAGKSSVETLKKLGIKTIGDLAKAPVDYIEDHIGNHGRMLWEYANGIDKRVVERQREEIKGVGNSITLARDYTKIEDVLHILLKLSEKVASRLRKDKKMAKTIGIELKYNDFSKVSKQVSVEVATDSSTTIYEIVKELLPPLMVKPIRLIGVRTTNLIKEDEPYQMTLFDFGNGGNEADVSKVNVNKSSSRLDKKKKLKKLDEAFDKINDKYGQGMISRASLMEDENER